MSLITFPTHHKDSPRTYFLKDLMAAMVNGDKEFLSETVPDDTMSHIAGHKAVKGRNEFIAEAQKQARWNAKELTVEKIITHGAEAAVSGWFTADDGEKYSFCDIYTFKTAGGAALKSITSFIV